MVGDDVPAAQAAFLRYALGAVFLLPMIPALRAAHFTPRILKLSGLRGLVHALGVICWFLRHDPHPHRRSHGDELSSTRSM